MTPAEADAIIDHVVGGVRTQFATASDEARLTRAEQATLMGREILSPYIFYDAP